MRLLNSTNDKELAHVVSIASGLLARMKGLLGRRKFEVGECLWIRPCNSIHTLGMNFPIDVLFLDRNNTIIGMRHNMQVNRITGIYFHASSVLELPIGTLDRTNTEVGNRIEIV